MAALTAKGSPAGDKRIERRTGEREKVVSAKGETVFGGQVKMERMMGEGIEMIGQDVTRALDVAGSIAERGMSAKIDRRRFVRMAAGLGAAALAGGVLKAMPAAAAGGAYYRAITNVNLRKKANNNSAIMLVIPAGAIVEDKGVAKNGYYKVKYGGHIGWAWGQLLESTNPDANVNFIGLYVTTSSVNFREGPGTNYAVKQVLPKGTYVDASDKELDGFRLCRLNGEYGWIYEAYLVNANSQGGAATPMTTTSNLNLREQPNTSAKIILVIPMGAKVTAYDDSENGFRWVSYNGKSGWAYDAYLV
jgi:uncharacterized protein YgiM (DUF1202 family)